MHENLFRLVLLLQFEPQTWASAVPVLGSFGTAIVALYIAQQGWARQETARAEQTAALEREWIYRHEQENIAAQAQARLVLVDNMGGPDPAPKTSGTTYIHRLRVINHSEHPILNIAAEVWVDPDIIEAGPSGASTIAVLLPGKEQMFPCAIYHDTNTLSAWQVRWTDHIGRNWRCDANKEPGRPYDGTPPRRYPAPCDTVGGVPAVSRLDRQEDLLSLNTPRLTSIAMLLP